MEEDAGRQPVSRRAFLRAIGSGASALAICSFRVQVAEPRNDHSSVRPPFKRRPLRVGILLPQPSTYPGLGNSVFAGMELFLSRHSSAAVRQPISLFARESAVLPDRALAQTRALVRSLEADVVVVMVRSGVAADLHTLLDDAQIPLVVVGAGANVPRDADQRSSIMRNTLGIWRANWALGEWAARTLGQTAFLAMSFYDSGYDANYLFQLGFEGAGGTVLDTQVTHRPTDSPAHLGGVIDRIRQSNPDLVFAGYTGNAALEFVSAYAAAGLHKRIPLLGSGFLADDRHLPELGASAIGVTSVLGWAASLPNDENRAFTGAFQRRFGRLPDSFALLGYETAQLIATAADDAGGEIGAPLRMALAKVAFAGPRGAVAMDPQALDVATPLYRREVQGPPDRVHNQLVGELIAPSLLDERFLPIRVATKTGWQNAYFCV